MQFIKTIPRVIACFIAVIAFSSVAQEVRLQPLPFFGTHGDGSVRPGDVPFLTADGNRYQRGIAYNPTTGHLLVVNRNPAAPGIYLLDGEVGDAVGSIEFIGAEPGGNPGFPINLIAVADDGAIYVGNLSSSSNPPEFRLYRWENETAGQTTVYAGDPSNGNTNSVNRRWGDTMAVRGMGTNTEILLASRGILISLLAPVAGNMETFTATAVTTSVPTGALGYGLTFGPTNTIFGTAGAQSGGPLYVLGHAPGATNAPTLRTFGSALVANTLTPIATGRAFGRDLLAGISMQAGPDVVRLYDVSAGPTNAPLFMDRKSFITDTTNAIFAGAVAFGPNRVYALDSDNGIMGFAIVEANSPVAPAFIVQPASRNVLIGSNVTFAATADGTAPFTYQWLVNSNVLTGQTNSSLIISNAQAADSGSYSVIVSNAVGSIQSANAVLSVAAQPISTLFVYDPFDYVVASIIAGQGGWVLNSGTSATSEADNLAVPGLIASSGNRIFWRASSMSLRLPLGTNITSGSTYYSFAMNVETIGGGFTGNGVLAGLTTGTGTSFGTKVDIRNNAGSSFTLGTSKAGSGTQVFDTNNFVPGTIIFLVGRYTFNPGGGDDVAELWINPDPATFGAGSPPPANLTTTGGTDLAQIDRFFFRAGSASTTPDKLVVDELRVGGTWADVTPSFAVVAPRLSIARASQSIVLQWFAPPDSFALETANSLPASWQSVGQPVSHSNGFNTITIPIDDTRGFFRLIQ